MGLRTRVAVVCAAAVLALLSRTPTALAENVDHALGHKLGRVAGTDSKPQSKLWFHDGSWWCVLPLKQGNRIHELVAHEWQAHESPDALLADKNGRADVLWDGQRLIVLMFGPQSTLNEFTYEADTRTWQPVEGFPVDLPIPATSETAVVEQDSQGRLWITWAADTQVRVVHSTNDHRQWNFPGQVLRDAVSDDEVSTIVSIGGNALGVFWSDQARSEFGFRARRDTDDPQVWGEVETLQGGERFADDHLNACVDAQGRVYVVTKNGAHELSAHLRDTDGQWTTHANILDGGHGTRPIVMVSDEDARVHLLYSRWHDGLEIIAHRQAPLGSLEFSAAQPFLVLLGEDVRLKDVTSTKRALPTGTLVAIAHARKRAWWQGWGQGVSSGLSHRPSHTLHVSNVSRTPDAALALAFDTGQGAELADTSPQAHRVVLGGDWAHDMSEPRWVSGVSGTALRFDGWRNYVSVPDAPDLTPQGSFTIEAWVKRYRQWDNHVVVSKGAPGRRSYQLRVEKENRIEFLRNVEGGKQKHRVRSTATIADSMWHHIACVIDLERQETRIYLDGAQVAAAPDSGVTVHTDLAMYVGARVYKDRLREWWPGVIDQVRLTPEALYDADFVPAPDFPSSGAAVFLSWSPPYTGPARDVRYQVLRSVDGQDFVPLFADPVRRMHHFDVPQTPGRVTYRVRLTQGDWAGPADQQLEWLPATAPPVPAVTDSSAVTRR